MGFSIKDTIQDQIKLSSENADATSISTIPIEDLSAITNGDMLIYNSITKQFELANGANAITLQGVDIDDSAPTNGNVLTYNSMSNEWRPQAPSGGSGTVTTINISNINTIDIESKDFTPGTGSFIQGYNNKLSSTSELLSLRLFPDVSLTANTRYFINFDSPGDFGGITVPTGIDASGVITVLNTTTLTASSTGFVTLGTDGPGADKFSINFISTSASANGDDILYFVIPTNV
jgi:hypothetical protein